MNIITVKIGDYIEGIELIYNGVNAFTHNLRLQVDKIYQYSDGHLSLDGRADDSYGGARGTMIDTHDGPIKQIDKSEMIFSGLPCAKINYETNTRYIVYNPYNHNDFGTRKEVNEATIDLDKLKYTKYPPLIVDPELDGTDKDGIELQQLRITLQPGTFIRAYEYPLAVITKISENNERNNSFDIEYKAIKSTEGYSPRDIYITNHSRSVSKLSIEFESKTTKNYNSLRYNDIIIIDNPKDNPDIKIYATKNLDNAYKNYIKVFGNE